MPSAFECLVVGIISCDMLEIDTEADVHTRRQHLAVFAGIPLDVAMQPADTYGNATPTLQPL